MRSAEHRSCLVVSCQLSCSPRQRHISCSDINMAVDVVSPLTAVGEVGTVCCKSVAWGGEVKEHIIPDMP